MLATWHTISRAELAPTEDVGEMSRAELAPTEDVGEISRAELAPTEDVGEMSRAQLAPTGRKPTANSQYQGENTNAKYEILPGDCVNTRDAH